jgi:hypothetical protein
MSEAEVEKSEGQAWGIQAIYFENIFVTDCFMVNAVWIF